MRKFFSSLCRLPSIIWRKLVTLNLFKRSGQQNDEERIQFQLQTTRLYLCILINTLIILAIYRIASIYEFQKTISHPSSETFETLYKQHIDTLNCPCKQISIGYSQFIDVNYTLHPICLSNFIQKSWFGSISTTHKIYGDDFRKTAISFFQILKSLCELANDTIVNIRSSFLAQQFLSTTLLSSQEFTKQIQTSIDIFQSNTRSTYIRSLRLIRDTTCGNALLAAYGSVWG